MLERSAVTKTGGDADPLECNEGIAGSFHSSRRWLRSVAAHCEAGIQVHLILVIRENRDEKRALLADDAPAFCS